jgi:protein-tyrosine kinase
MSLIESALEKLRRGGEVEARAGAPKARSVAALSPGGPKGSATPPAVGARPPDPHLKRVRIDPQALRHAGYLPDEGLERRFADHYRQIKRPLIEKALTGTPDMRLIMVSSALPGDGKTFTSINLGLSMARERDVSVLLVDADAPRSQISDVFGLRGERGLIEALRDESIDVESLVVDTDVRGFELLPAGKFVEGATELFASTRMEQVSARLIERNPRRIVILDSAPLLVSSEARVLLRIPGQVVLIVRAGKTPKQAIVDAVAHVDKRRLQGVVLNQASIRKTSGYYYGYPGHDPDKEVDDHPRT